jgi:hypothetical protein
MKPLHFLILPALICLISCSDDDDNVVEAPDYIKVKTVFLDKFPATDNGAGWDILDGPDLYFTISYNGAEIYSSRSNSQNNATGTVAAWAITGNLNLDYPADQYVIRVYDYDFPDADDFIGGMNFTPFIQANGLPAVIPLTCSGCSTEWRLDVEYVK